MADTADNQQSASFLRALRAEHSLVRSETWENEPELMSLLEEALNVYWECLSRLHGHEMADDVEEILVYLSAASFQTLQSCFALIELGHYRQAGAVIRLVMNEYLLSSKLRRDPDAAATFRTGSDWARVQELGASVLPALQGLNGYPARLCVHLSAALREGLSWTAYVAATELMHCTEVSKATKKSLQALVDELQEDRVPGMTALLKQLEAIGVSKEKVLEHRFDLELLHRHAHVSPVTVRAEVEARNGEGGQWITPRYERGRCRYCGYHLALWSTLVPGVLTDHFEVLSTDESWTERLDGFSGALRTWAEGAELERRATMS